MGVGITTCVKYGGGGGDYYNAAGSKKKISAVFYPSKASPCGTKTRRKNKKMPASKNKLMKPKEG
jgi:hypothetical protein